jgi:protein-S-isoprenylcysteine O-methyltransferase Ste14
VRVIDAAIGVLWIAFGLYWLVSAVGVKRGRGRTRGFVVARLAAALVMVALIRAGVGRQSITHDPAMEFAGIAVQAAGLALAVWARRYLGRNWGMPMTQKLEPELVTGGPYRSIRHPIYTGLILGMTGTAIATTVYALAPVAVLSGYFVYSARMEERYLAGQFPASYPDYRRRTKMLVPYLF